MATSMRRLAVAGAGALCALLLAVCAAMASADDDGSGGGEQSAIAAAVRAAEEQMPEAPHERAAWLHAIDRAYASVDGGRGAEQWLRQRMELRQPGERLAVVMGIDDVIVQTDYAGTGVVVPRSVRFAKAAHALGYAVFFVTGRSYAQGLGRIETLLAHAGVAASGFCPPPAGVTDEVTAKTQCRASLQADGYTLAMSVAADGAGLVGEPEAEQVVRLPEYDPST
jgi:hypothetical protein